MRPNPYTSNYNLRLLGVLLVLGLVHGLIYVFLVPPWQHYDEPNHFEYVWLTAHQSGLPKPGDRDLELNRMVVGSMLANGFFKGMSYRPDLNSPNLVINGYSQLDEPPLYYLAASLPLRFLGDVPIETQLHAARLVSLLFFLLTILAAWGTVSEITAPGNPLRWLVPLFLVFLPSFVDLMTAVNNDATAVASFSWFLWGSVRLIKRGITVLDFIWLSLAAVACYFSKSTVFIALPLVLVVLLFALLRGRLRPLAWWTLALLALALFVVSLSWGDAALWYRSTAQSNITRVVMKESVLGEHAIEVDAQVPVTPPWLVPLFQPVPLESVQKLTNRTVTLGAWIWASEPVRARTAQLSDGFQTKYDVVELTQSPVFHAITMTLSSDNNRLWVSLLPEVSRDAGAVKIYYDGIVLADGVRSLQIAPSFSDPGGRGGDWGGEPFINLVRNGSGEVAGPRIRSWIDDLGARVLPDHTRPSLILTSLLDWRAADWFYQLTAERLFRTFWATFGTGNVALMAGRPYRVLVVFTLTGLLGAILGFWRNRHLIQWELFFILGLTLFIVWTAALVRSPIYLAVPHLYFPVARYAYPAIIPTAFILCSGWLEIFELVGLSLKRFGRKNFSKYLPIITFSSLFVFLDIFSILSIHHFYLH